MHHQFSTPHIYFAACARGALFRKHPSLCYGASVQSSMTFTLPHACGGWVSFGSIHSVMRHQLSTPRVTLPSPTLKIKTVPHARRPGGGGPEAAAAAGAGAAGAAGGAPAAGREGRAAEHHGRRAQVLSGPALACGDGDLGFWRVRVRLRSE